MEVLIVILIGVFILLWRLFFRHVARRMEQQNMERDVQEALSRRGPLHVLEELDAKIRDKRARIAKMESNAGMIYAAGGDEVLDEEHRELRRLEQSRKLAAHYAEERGIID